MSPRHIATLAALSFLLVRSAQATTLAEQIDQIHEIDSARAAESDVARANALLARSARLKQAAIAHAIAEYRIQVRSTVAGVQYTPHGNMRERDGVTLEDRDGTIRVQLGDAAFRSAAWLGSTIAHEVEVHVERQIAKGIHDRSGDDQGLAIHEVEAYDHELAGHARFGLSDEEQEQLRHRRASWYRTLQYENRKRVDEGNYVKW